MKTTQEVVSILRQARPQLSRRFGVKRLALFGSYARGEQRDESDVDVLVEVEPFFGLRFVDLADEIETLLGFAPRSSRGAPSPLRTGCSSRRSFWMSRRPVRLLLDDMLDRIELVWQIIHAELPELKERLRALRRGADEDSA